MGNNENNQEMVEVVTSEQLDELEDVMNRGLAEGNVSAKTMEHIEHLLDVITMAEHRGVPVRFVRDESASDEVKIAC
ncbi:hypothetical protein AB835_08055 [Candidatus Endobugula sertula]|uniref:Uncharacterized protein n=1 Tax=Candidatus Endobugula sertula TaxID=62101 RepID=A0A1D2QPQ2_9GAMM|nr:hypothetical protein AB835_08055 [Candidatus Endobugula sertula]